MLVLVIDTSGEKGNLCLGKGGKVLNIRRLSPRSSSESIFPALDKLIGENNLKIKDLQGIIVNLGPGSFTGLRIGLSLAKALSFSLKIPLAGVSLLDSWAFFVPEEEIICPLRQAYKERFYGAFYKRDRGKISRITEYLFFSFEEVMERGKRFLPQKVTFLISNENRKIGYKIKRGEGFFTYFIENSLSLKILLDFGIKSIKEEKIDNSYTLVPLYISPPKIGLTKKKKLERASY
ncbi:MAG: tRNA (adenosine(37)-N6)-threonylcarbamoyltransferase complex dimerization subunit type 1 TsaB [Candidatus Aerophobetes bacterium]|nr:tRNA (adenosine(37)-N6)-threonylcarbamoyltransferase complex dimerization subunit type 1 TsaB [Candidatus Aerophobetes bacterium]